MSSLDALFADLWSGLAPDKPVDFQAFPGEKKADLERQVIDNKSISSVSRVSSPGKEGNGFLGSKNTQAGAGGRGRAGARDPIENRLEMLETLEKPLPASSCVSSYLSKKLEIKEETGKPGPLPAALPVAPTARLPLSPEDRSPSHWRAALARMSPAVTPAPGYTLAGWQVVRSRALAFLDAFGEQAEALGWDGHRLFSVHPEIGIVRVDHCGALVLPIGGPVRAITANTISFGHLTHREKPGQPQGIPIWDFGR